MNRAMTIEVSRLNMLLRTKPAPAKPAPRSTREARDVSEVRGTGAFGGPAGVGAQRAAWVWRCFQLAVRREWKERFSDCCRYDRGRAGPWSQTRHLHDSRTQPPTESVNASVASEESPEPSVSGAARRKPVLQTPVSPGQAAGRYPLLVLLPFILIAVAGVTLGLQRATVYTATAQVAVREPIAPNAAELPGVITATQQLAANDARLIVSPNVVAPLAPQFGVPSSALAGRLSATPIPNATVISISATGPDAASAIRLANDASKNFASYLTQSLQSTGAETAVLALGIGRLHGRWLPPRTRSRPSTETTSEAAATLRSRRPWQPSTQPRSS
jgi:hypothetical protein